MKKGIAIIVYLICLSMFSSLFAQTSQKLYNEGLMAYQEGRVEIAVDKLSKALDLENAKGSKDKQLLSNIYNIRGEVYLSEGVAILSQSDFNMALEHNPDNESALNNLGIWFSIEQFSTPDYDKSINYLTKALKINPNRKDIRLNRAVIRIRSGDNEKGCNELKELDEQDYPNAKIGLERFCKD